MGNGGLEFNVNSPAQLGEVLFDKLGWSQPGSAGGPKVRSTAVEISGGAFGEAPLPAKAIEYREIAKLKSTYVDARPKLIHPETKRLHTGFSQTNARPAG